MRPTQLGKPDEVLTPLFGESQATLVAHARKLGDLQRAAQGARARRRRAQGAADRARAQDAARVLARPARRAAAPRLAAADAALLRGEQDAVPARARRRGDAGVRAARQPARHLADQVGARGPRVPLPRSRAATTRSPRLLDERRADREARVAACAPSLAADLAAHGLAARGAGAAEAPLQHLEEDAAGRASRFGEVLDVRRAARHRRRRRRLLRGARRACTSAVARSPASSTTTSRGRRRTATARCTRWSRATTAGAVEIQIRTQEMHEHAEYGVVGALGLQGGRCRAVRAAAAGGRVRGERRARRGWSCCASCSPGSATSPATARPARSARRPRRQARASTTASTSSRRRRRVVELTAGATPIDFAYAVHTDLGHRCRGAKVDGAIVPLNTPLQSGQIGRGHRRQGRRARRSTGSTPSSATCRARARRPRCAPGSTR